MNADHALLTTVVETILDESPRQLTAMRHAIARGDAAGLSLAAHTLKGAIRLFGANAAYDHAWRLERMGEEGNLQNAEETLAALKEELEKLTPVLLKYVERNDTANDT